MQSFYNFYLQQEHKTLNLDGEKWFVFDKSPINDIEVFVKFKNKYILKKGSYFKAIKPINTRFYIIDKGNVDFFDRGIFVKIENETVLSEYETEEDAIEASELSFTGFKDPEGEDFEDKYADKLTDIGLPHK